jgi:DNA polymerase-3 subunit alpha
MLDGAAKLGNLFSVAEGMGMPAVAITDHGNIFGAAEFYDQAKKHPSVKPIIGIEAYLAPGSRWHKKPVYWGDTSQRATDEYGEGGDVSGNGSFTHMIMLAASATGLRNLFALTTRGWTEGYYRKPRMDRETLAEHAQGIIATTGCPSGEVQTRLRLGQRKEAIEAAAAYRDIFGVENFYLEVMDHGLSIERSVREGLLEVGRKLGLTPLATNDSHYVTADQAEAHAALLCVQTGKTVNDPTRFKFDGTGYYLKSAEEMRSYWDSELPGAADATLAIAERVESYDELFTFNDRMPLFKIPVSPLHLAAQEQLNVRQGGQLPATSLIVRVDQIPALEPLRASLVQHEGTTPVCVVLCGDDEETVVAADEFPVHVSATLLRELSKIDGVTVP